MVIPTLWVVNTPVMATNDAVMADSPKAIGERIRAGREKMGITQRQLADEVGATEVSVSGWERGLSVPKQPNFGRLALLLGLSENELRYGSPPAPRRVAETPSGHNYTTGRPKLPPRAYERVYNYVERLRTAGIPEDMIDEAERLMVEPLFSKFNKRDIRERTEEDHITDIDAAWSWIREVAEREWGKTIK